MRIVDLLADICVCFSQFVDNPVKCVFSIFYSAVLINSKLDQETNKL